MMDKLIAQCVDYMKIRTQGGKKLAEHQGLQWMLADMSVARDAARGLTQRAIETLVRGERGTLEASSAKLFTTEALAKVVDCAVQIHGGMGYMREVGHRDDLPRCADRADLRRHLGDPAEHHRGAIVKERLTAFTTKDTKDTKEERTALTRRTLRTQRFYRFFLRVPRVLCGKAFWFPFAPLCP